MKFFDKNNLPFGLILGIAFPLLGYGLLKGLFWVLSQWVNSDYGDWRTRTITLLAICFNLIPFNAFIKGKHENSMRGVIIPTVIYGATWAFIYREFILGN